MPQPTHSQLGAAIRSVREERDLTIEGLADVTVLHSRSISRIERGRQNATWTALVDIATALDVDLIDLVKLAGEQSP